MGYYVEYDIAVTIPAERAPEVIAAINALHDPELMASQSHAGTYQGGVRTHVRYSWTDNPPPGGFTTMEEAFLAWRFNLYSTNEGSQFSFTWCGEKCGDEEHFFRALAPFANGSIYARGEDGAEWGYQYKDSEMRELQCIKQWVSS
ncbi:MAG: hypothetical protein IPL32_17510 [Chloracidobacterium sp.]|nr:hypothetical protein [Chloracidobacterium sp.]